LRIMVNFQLR
ncbi:MAG: hypothetical protein GW878_00285, partial [Acidobacteria bacterium]|nr:hypothetical protein [Acidobacteriota bacterium]